jgi:serine/threonine protein kinase
MNPERWRRVEQIYHSTKDRKPGERNAFLVNACEGDDELRREVELLLVQDAEAEPTILTAATQTQLGLGSELGSYRMEAVLGAGGMGVVYRAWDQRLRRNVAIKLLNQSGADRRQRSLLLTESSRSGSPEPPRCGDHLRGGRNRRLRVPGYGADNGHESAGLAECGSHGFTFYPQHCRPDRRCTRRGARFERNAT